MSAARPRVRGISLQKRRKLAARYVWWLDPAETLRRPRLLLRQILRFGTEDDYVAARRQWGSAAFRRALVTAPPGTLDQRSWVFWHRHYGLKPQPFPRRHFA